MAKLAKIYAADTGDLLGYAPKRWLADCLAEIFGAGCGIRGDGSILRAGVVVGKIKWD